MENNPKSIKSKNKIIASVTLTKRRGIWEGLERDMNRILQRGVSKKHWLPKRRNGKSLKIKACCPCLWVRMGAWGCDTTVRLWVRVCVFGRHFWLSLFLAGISGSDLAQPYLPPPPTSPFPHFSRVVTYYYEFPMICKNNINLKFHGGLGLKAWAQGLGLKAWA